MMIRFNLVAFCDRNQKWSKTLCWNNRESSRNDKFVFDIEKTENYWGMTSLLLSTFYAGLPRNHPMLREVLYSSW